MAIPARDLVNVGICKQFLEGTRALATCCIVFVHNEIIEPDFIEMMYSRWQFS